MSKKVILISFVSLFPLFAISAAKFDKDVVSKVVTWDDQAEYVVGRNEAFVRSTYGPDDRFVLGKILAIEPIFPPHNRQPLGLVTMEVCEGDEAGEQIKFVTLNVFFECEEDTPFLHCRQSPESRGSLISIQTDDHPWVLPGDTVMAILRPHKIQLEETEEKTLELAYARFLRTPYDKTQNQGTYGQEFRSWAQTFDGAGYRRRADREKTAYEYLRLRRIRDPHVTTATEF